MSICAAAMGMLRKSAVPTLAATLALAMPAQAGFDEAVAAYNSGNYQAAYAEFRALAEEGSASAMNNLGLMYATGKGVRQSYNQARQWYRKAAALAHAGAMNNLGVMAELGQGMKRDYAEAQKWYHFAAERGLADAQFNLAALCENGRGGPKDLKQAYIWYSLAAARGDADAAKARTRLARSMSPAQITDADALVSAWKPQE
jgi:TPR repeat protein